MENFLLECVTVAVLLVLFLGVHFVWSFFKNDENITLIRRDSCQCTVGESISVACLEFFYRGQNI